MAAVISARRYSNCENTNGNRAASSGQVGSSSNGGGGSSDSVEESQDDEPSSSFPSLHQVENELESFRLQWQKEIESSPYEEKPVPNIQKKSPDNVDDIESVEEKAKYLFINGVKAERNGKLHDAIALYRRAIQLVPDIEFKVEESMYDYFDDYIEESSDESEIENYSENETDDLINKFKRIAAKSGVRTICDPKIDQKASHISCLPPEIFLYILKWLVSQDLDVVSLEQVAKVCHGFYLGARDPGIWKSICLRTWDMNVDNPNCYGSWRNMFIQRPHLSFNGVYISKTTYVRYGESVFQDANYRPCYVVEYYRYLRFFPDGCVLMLTTPNDPYQSLYKLQDKKPKDPNIMEGRYKLVGSVVIATVKKPMKDNVNPVINYRFRRQRQLNLQDNKEQTFHLELEVKSVKKRINCQLIWKHYSIHMDYRNGEETVSNFDIVPSNFPCFWFSRVKSFTTESESPLK